MSSAVVVEVSSSSKFIWKIENFSKLNSEDGLFSGVFSAGSFKWRVLVYPKGYGEMNDHLSLFLAPVDLTKSVCARFSFAVTSQTNSKNRVTKDFEHSFTAERISSWGWPNFMRLSELHDPAKGYIVNDTCIITVEVSWSLEEDTIDGSILAGVKLESDPEEVAETETDKETELKDGNSGAQLGEYPGAGQPFGEGRHNNTEVGFGEDKHEYEDVGGFSILKTQAPMYMQIWLKYGHIPSTKVMPISSYALLVMAVKDLMNSILDMHQCRYIDLSSEMIQCWEEKIHMAEAIKFNIGWLRERLESVKKGLGGMQKVKTELLEHGQPFRAAKSKIKTIEDELNKTQAQLIAAKDYLRQNLSDGVLSESDMEIYLEIGENLLLEGLF